SGGHQALCSSPTRRSSDLSIYRYFTSAEELLAGVVADVFPDWAGRVRARMEAAPSPGEKVWAYVEANMDLFASTEQDVASALSRSEEHTSELQSRENLVCR